MTDFSNAVSAIDAGDVDALRETLARCPEVLTERAPADEGHYAGYFAGATLLHHVAGNPVRAPLPDNAAELARVLLEHGAAVDATCGFGPSQPDSGAWTTLGLVASSAAVAQSGRAAELIDVLLQAGADVDHQNGSNLHTALYHVVECRAQRDVATLLHERGARVDLGLAAGLGRDDLVAGFLAEGVPSPEAWQGLRGKRETGSRPADAEIVQEALLFACAGGRTETAELLLSSGARLDDLQQFGPLQVTPLHCACWAGWPDTARMLSERGADQNVYDPTHVATPIGWASYCGHPEVVDALRPFEDRFDLIGLASFGSETAFARALAGRDPDAAVPPAAAGVLLRVAAWEGNTANVRTLLAAGATLVPSQAGHTALDFARENGHGEIVALLEAAGGQRSSS